MQLNRLFEITYILMNKQSVTAKELAERFGVSTRTIYRDIDALSLAGIPVYTEKGKGGGISLLPDFVLSKSILSEQEQSEILSALQGLSNVRTAETDQILRKLSTIFNKPVENWIDVDFSDWSYSTDFFGDFKTAILERRVVEFEYYNRQGEKSRRRVEPIQLCFKHKAWYVAGFCLVKQDARFFKLSRVKNLTLSDEHFAIRDFSALPSSDGEDLGLYEYVTLKLKISPEMAYRVFDEFAEDMVERQPDDSFIVTVTWLDDEWTYGTLLSFGEHIEVLEPAHIRDAVKDKAKKIVEKYL